MNNRDMRRAFGTPDAEFSGRVNATLRAIMKEEKPVRKIRIGIAIALGACLLLAAVGLAAASHLGLLDFVNNLADVNILPDATDLVQTNVPQIGGETEYATFSLREAIYDGEYAYMLFDVKPKEGVLLLGVDSDPAYSMQDLTREESGLTIEAYAAANNLRMIYTNIGTGLEDVSLDFRMREDGTLEYGIRGEAVPELSQETLKMKVVCIAYPADYTNFDADVRRGELVFSLQKAETLAAGASASMAEFPSCGVRVESIELRATAMGLYYELYYTVTDQAALDSVEDGLWFEFLDESGQRMGGGATGRDSVRMYEGGYLQKGSLGAVKEIPDSLTLRAYNAWEKQRYETVEVAIEAE